MKKEGPPLGLTFPWHQEPASPSLHGVEAVAVDERRRQSDARSAGEANGKPIKSANGAKARLSSADRVFRDVVQGLYEERFVPGQRLVETDLIRQYRVSRGSVREALNRLAAEGVVTINLHRGASIRWLTREEVHDILVFLETLFGLAASLAAEAVEQCGADERFAAALDRLLSFEQNPESFEFIRARNQFYRTIVHLSGNSEVKRVFPSVQIHLVRVQSRAYYNWAEAKLFDDYREIGEAILVGDPKRAEASTRRHVRRMLKRLNRLPHSAFAPPKA